MVATQHHLASEVGLSILKKGGNAYDATTAVGFALAVVLPRAGNLGGGGFMLHYNQESEKVLALNYREMAPSLAHKNMYLNESGKVDNKLFNQSYLSVGVPGTVAGMIYIQNKHGKMSLQEVMQPAIDLARNGFPITQDLSDALKTYKERMQKCAATAKIFYPENGFYEAGDTLVQSDLAQSLELIAVHGTEVFYNGQLGEKITSGIRKNGGIISLDDFKKYKVKETEAVKGTYRNAEIASMPPPSSGGVHLIQMLNILEHHDLQSLGFNSAAYIHLLTESMRYAYADRSKHLGDPDFWEVPVEGLVSKKYAEDLNKNISIEKATPSESVAPGNPHAYESDETTHYSIADKWGNLISNTYTLNFSFGSGLMIEGTGILLNNEMGDFSAKPGTANAYGLIGGEANKIEAFKQPLSSMTPTIVFQDGKPILATGTPGGSRIITSVLQIILNIVDHKMNVAEATHAPRIHHQWLPDILYYEAPFNADTYELLKNKGHNLKKRNAMGSTQSILIEGGWFRGSSDPRRPDGKTLGY